MKWKLLICALALSAAACAQQSRFEWGNYENSLYALYKNPEAAEGYETTLRRAIERGEQTNRVAPGMNAELGYLLYEQGRREEAEEYFLRERELFPESGRFMSRYLGDQAVGGASVEEGEAAAGASDSALNS